MSEQSQITIEVSYPDDKRHKAVVEQLQRLTCTIDETDGFHVILPPRSYQSLYRRTITTESGPNCFDEDCGHETVRLEEKHYVSYIRRPDTGQHTIHWIWQRERRFSFGMCFYDTSVLSWYVIGGGLETPTEDEEDGHTCEHRPSLFAQRLFIAPAAIASALTTMLPKFSLSRLELIRKPT